MPRRPDLSRPENLLPLRALDFSILLVLEQGDRYGYSLAQAVAEEGFGGIVLAPGNLYQVIERLIDWGVLVETEPRSGPDDVTERRRYYSLTDFGCEVLRLEASRLRRMMPNVEPLRASPSRSS